MDPSDDEPDAERSTSRTPGRTLHEGTPSVTTDHFDPQVIRRDFPLFERDFEGRSLAYLDSAATSLKPRVVLDAVEGYNARFTANVHRGIYTTGEEATAAYEDARVAVATFLNAPDSHEIVFVRNATEAINLVASTWGRQNIGRGDTIVLTEMEHHSNLVPWQLLAQERGAVLEFVPFDEDGRLEQDVFEALLETRPQLVAFTHKSNALGTLNPVREMVRQAHDAGALVLVDGAQAVPHVAVDVQAIGADFYAFSGHKVLAPTGSGALWARRELLEAMPPFMSGGEMISSVSLRHTTFNEVPHKFEAGTPDIAAAIGLGAAVRYLGALGMDAVAAHERSLTAYALDVLPREVPGLHPPSGRTIRPCGRASSRSRCPSAHAHDVATLLDRVAVAIRAGHHCTQPLHERLGVSATGRASFNVYSDRDHVDRLAAGLRDVVRASSVAAGGPHVVGEVPAGVRADSAPARERRPGRSDLVRRPVVARTASSTLFESHGRPLPRRDPRALPPAPQLRDAGGRRTSSRRATTRSAATASRCRSRSPRTGASKTSPSRAAAAPISQASASMLTDDIRGRTIGELESLRSDDVLDLLGIEISPARLKCALLSLDTLQHALQDRESGAATGANEVRA